VRSKVSAKRKPRSTISGARSKPMDNTVGLVWQCRTAGRKGEMEYQNDVASLPN